MDQELKDKIKKMEAEKRAKILSSQEVKIVTADPDNKITYDQWWIYVNKKFTLKTWMKEVLKADFKGRGLSDSETRETFDEALVKCGYKI